MYNRLWPRWVPFAVTLPLTALFIAMVVTRGVKSLTPWIILVVDAIALIVLAILDPEVTIETHKVLLDGRLVPVRRPIVGFKRCEREVGVTGGYEVRVDGFRYEEAYFRI